MTCPACTTRETKPDHGIYYAACTGCQTHALRMSPAYADHMRNVKGIPGSRDRAAYFDAVERSSGKPLADVLRFDYAEWWEARRAAKTTKA